MLDLPVSVVNSFRSSLASHLKITTMASAITAANDTYTQMHSTYAAIMSETRGSNGYFNAAVAAAFADYLEGNIKDLVH